MKVNLEQKTILHVDDDPEVREVVRMMLEECGHKVLQAPDGETALVLLQVEDQIDLLFTDIAMPGISGIELARRARQPNPSLKVLFTSGHPAEWFPNLKPTDRVVKKPYRRLQLAEAIADALANSPDSDRPCRRIGGDRSRPQW